MIRELNIVVFHLLDDKLELEKKMIEWKNVPGFHVNYHLETDMTWKASYEQLDYAILSLFAKLPNRNQASELQLLEEKLRDKFYIAFADWRLPLSNKFLKVIGTFKPIYLYSSLPNPLDSILQERILIRKKTEKKQPIRKAAAKKAAPKKAAKKSAPKRAATKSHSLNTVTGRPVKILLEPIERAAKGADILVLEGPIRFPGPPTPMPILPSRSKGTVDCTIYAPARSSPGQKFLVQVFLHTSADATKVAEKAKAIDKNSNFRNDAVLNEQLESGAKIGVHLNIPGLRIDEAQQFVIWRKSISSVQFGVAVPAAHKLVSVFGTVYVSLNRVPIGHLKFTLEVISPSSLKSSQKPRVKKVTDLKPYRRAFISYASEDRSKVLMRTQMLKLAKIDFFQDLIHLNPGDRWERELYKNIDDSDVFFLFWSSAAKASKWVMKELDYAAAISMKNKNGPPEIIPVIIEGPPPAKPPVRYNHLHFNDTSIFLINPRRPSKNKPAK